jgi:hypothetical protein
VGAWRRNTWAVLRREKAAEFPHQKQELQTRMGRVTTPPVLQGSAVCLRNTAKHMTEKSTLTLF